jgi:hypothetical protein
MALTPMRWMALALLGFVLAPVVILRDAETREWRPTERDRLIERSNAAQTRLGRAADQLRRLQLRDSVSRIAMLASSPAFAIDATFDTASRGLVASIVAGVRDERAVAARIPTNVFFVLDTMTQVRGHSRGIGSRGALAIDYVLPSDSTRRCIAIARVRTVTTRRLYEAELRSSTTRERLLGPCAFFEHFGMPGKAVRTWLDDRGWQFAQRASWGKPQIPWLEGSPDSAYRSLIDLEYVMGTSGRACLGGNDAACEVALLTQAPVNAWQQTIGSGTGMLTPGYYNPFVHGDAAWPTRSWPLGAREWVLLADMVRALGPERFERFWTSDLPPKRAFEAAAGVPLAGWTRGWLETTYHPQATGPALSAGAAGFAALLLIASIGLTIFAARRRQMA